MKQMILFTLVGIAGLFIITILGLIVYLQITEYRPATIEPVQVSGKGQPLPWKKNEFNFLTWNLGYAGLGKTMDFFYEGGKKVRASQSETEANLKGISDELKSRDSVDFMLLQEIDVDSKRTYGQDQFAELGKTLPDYSSTLALNYKVSFLPIPLLEPIGKVTAGLCTFSKYPSENNERHAYEASFYWPKNLIWLKRCFITSTYIVGGGKQLIVVNLHNSAYDASGELRKKELAQLQDYLEREYMKGNYIIVGGDWNMNPRGFKEKEINSGDIVFSIKPSMDGAFLQSWKVVYDSSRPTNRNLTGPYQKGIMQTTIIDFFVISPNIKVLYCVTADKGFTYSDHNPVFARFRLMPVGEGATGL